MTDTEDDSQDLRLFPRPISVHGLTEAGFRRFYLGVLGRSVPLFLLMSASAGLVVDVCYPHEGPRSTLFAPLVSIAGLILSSPLLFISYRFRKRIATATVYETWPDRVVSRVAGRPPHTIPYSEVIRVRDGFLRTLVIHGKGGDPIVIPRDVSDFDALRDCVLRECAAAGNPRRWAAMMAQRVAFAIPLLVALYWLVTSDTPWVVLLCGTTAGAFYLGLAWRMSKRRHLDKLTWHWDVWSGVLAALMSLAFAMVRATIIWLGRAR